MSSLPPPKCVFSFAQIVLACRELLQGDGSSPIPLIPRGSITRPGPEPHAGSCRPCIPPGMVPGPKPAALLSERWSQEDMLTLLECMKNNLPSNDGSKFKTTESHLDWEKVAFKDFSGEMCKMKWMEISNEVPDGWGRSVRGTRYPSGIPGLLESVPP